MQHHGFVYVDLGHRVEGRADLVLDFRRVCPVGLVDTDTDDMPELIERLGLDSEIRAQLSTLVKLAQEHPGEPRGVNPSSYLATDYQLLAVVNVGEHASTLNYGILRDERDSPAEWLRRAQDLQTFCSQFAEALDLGAANPTLEIGTSLVFISDKGATVQA